MRLMSAGFVVAWSSGFVGATLAERTGAHPLTVLAWRYLMTTVVLAALCAVLPAARHGLLSMRRRDLLHQAAFGFLSHVLFLGGVFLAAGRGVDAGMSALVCALQPLVVAGASVVLFGDRLGRRQWLGLAIALAGVAVSVGSPGPANGAGLGLVLLALGALCLSALLERAWSPQLPVLTALLVQVAVGAACFTTAALTTGGIAVAVSDTLAVALGWLVVLSGLGGYATFTWCLRHLGATATSTLLYLTAPTTMLWALVMFGQHPSLMQWCGLAVVMTGVALALKR